jgi:prophage regulatory protein
MRDTLLAMPQALAAKLPVFPNCVGFLRLPMIIGDPKAIPPIPPIIPVCKSTWWQGVKEKRYPQPVKLSPRVTVWRASEIYALVTQSAGNQK